MVFSAFGTCPVFAGGVCWREKGFLVDFPIERCLCEESGLYSGAVCLGISKGFFGVLLFRKPEGYFSEWDTPP